jgi:hypothetical protein
MKNIRLIVAFALLVAVYSCVGNDSSTPSILDSELSGVLKGVRKFQTVSEYEFAIYRKNLKNIEGFVSMGEVVRDQSVDGTISGRIIEDDDPRKEFSDTYLLDIIDSDGMVIIEDYLIKLDFQQKMAFVTDNLLRIEDFRAGSLDFNDVMTYGFEEDLLTILFGEGGADSDQRIEENNQNARIASIGCPGPYAVGSTFPPMSGIGCGSRFCEFSTYHIEADFTYRADAKHVYQAAAVYFRMKSELAHFRNNHSNSTGWVATPSPGMSITYWGGYTPKNRPYQPLSGCYDQCQGCDTFNEDKVQKIHWEAGRRLDSFTLYGIFEVHLGGNHAPSGYPDVIQLYNLQEF